MALLSSILNSQPSVAYYGVISGAFSTSDFSLPPSSASKSSSVLKRLLGDLTSHRSEVVLNSLKEIIDRCTEGVGEEQSMKRRNRWLQGLRRAGIDNTLDIVSMGGNDEIQSLSRTLTGLLIGMDEDDDEKDGSGEGFGPIVKRFINGEEVFIREQSFKAADLGWRVWSSCDVFIDLLKGEGYGGEVDIDIKGKDLLELGCGTGLLGIICIKHGAKSIHMTDYHESVVQNAQRNALANQMDEKIVTTSVLDWFNVAEAYHNHSSTSFSTSSSSDVVDSSPFSLDSLRSHYSTIIGSDLMYRSQVADILPSAVRYLLKPTPQSIFYLVLPDARQREGVPEFEALMTKPAKEGGGGFKMKKVPIEDPHSGLPHAFYAFTYDEKEFESSTSIQS